MKHLYPVFNRAVVRKKQVAWTCLIAMHTLMLPTFADEIAAGAGQVLGIHLGHADH